MLAETVDGLVHRDVDIFDPRRDIPQLMSFYVSVAFVLVERIVFGVVKAYVGQQIFSSAMQIGTIEVLESTMLIVYCGIMASHSAMLNKKHHTICFAFIEETADADGTLPSPPRVRRSFLSILMSYLQTNLYLFALDLAVMGVSITLTKRNSLHPSAISLLLSILHFVGFFLYAYQVFNIRTNVAILMVCVFIANMDSSYLIYIMIVLLPVIYFKMFPHPTEPKRVVTGASVIPPSTGTSTASVETGAESNLLAQNDLVREQTSTSFVATDAPGWFISMMTCHRNN